MSAAAVGASGVVLLLERDGEPEEQQGVPEVGEDPEGAEAEQPPSPEATADQSTAAEEEGEGLTEQDEEDTTDEEQERSLWEAIVDDVRADHAAATNAELDCPRLEAVAVGQLYNCELTVEERTQVVQILLHDTDGTYHARSVGSADDAYSLDDVYRSVGEGAFCRDVSAAGYPYELAVAYWRAEGSPARMDATEDGIPCTTVYSSEAVDRYWDQVQRADR